MTGGRRVGCAAPDVARSYEIFSMRAASFLKSAWPETGSKARCATAFTSQRLSFGSELSATDKFHGENRPGHGTALRAELEPQYG